MRCLCVQGNETTYSNLLAMAYFNLNENDARISLVWRCPEDVGKSVATDKEDTTGSWHRY